MLLRLRRLGLLWSHMHRLLICVIDQAWDQAGWILIKFLFRIHGSKKTIITTQKRTRRPISSHLDRTSWDNKGFISWPKRYRCLAGPRRKMSKGKMGASFRRSRVVNQYTGFVSYYRLADSAMLIILKIAWVPCCWGCIVCLFLSKQSRFLFAWSTFQHAV